MNRTILFIISLIVGCCGLSAQNLSGVWSGPNNIVLTLKQDASGRIIVENCEIYRVDAWNVSATLANGVLTLKEKDTSKPNFVARLTITSPTTMKGSLKVGEPGDPSYFNGTAIFTKSGALDAAAQLHAMGGGTYIFSGDGDRMVLEFTVGAMARVEGMVVAQDNVNFTGDYSLDDYDVTIKTGNQYLGSNGYYVGTFSPDMQTLTIHNYSDGVYDSASRMLRLKKESATSTIPTSSINENDLGAVKPLTQYPLIKVLDEGIGVTFRDNIALQLKNLGFTVKTFKRPVYADEMETYKCLTATRQGKGGTTKITMTRGEDIIVNIDFANKAELDSFVNSMIVSHYEKDGSLYSHPENNLGKIYVRVNGLNVKIINPFEMLPSDF